ncbi:MAG: DsbA family protein [Polyangiaceae bacterium]
MSASRREFVGLGLKLAAVSLLAPGALVGCGHAPLSVPPQAPSKGASDPKLVIQELGDFECPFCAEVQPVLEQVLDHFGDQVRIVWRDYPLSHIHPYAMQAAEAAREVRAQLGEEGFWRYHHLLFMRQDALNRQGLESFARKLGGVDMTRFAQALDNQTHKAAILAEKAEVDNLGIDRLGTPGFFVGDEVIIGAQPFEVFRDAIQEQLGKTAG